jgi:hypothetical protein
MFLVMVLNPTTCKYVRRVFHHLSDAEEFCEYCNSNGIPAIELDKVDCELATEFALQ